MTRRLDPAVRALPNILRRISREIDASSTPNTTVCRYDGCLIRIKEKCPQCELAEQLRHCACGNRIRRPDADRCYDCRRKVPRTPCAGCAKWVRTPGEDLCHACRSLAPKPKCGCGRQIRAANQTACIACRREARRNTVTKEHTVPEEPDTRPVRWVRRAPSLIWQPVYEQSEVA